MDRPSILRPRARDCVDCEYIKDLNRTLGPDQATRVVETALQRLDENLPLAVAAFAKGNMDDLRRHLRVLRALATQTGMAELALAVGHMRDCIARGDGVAATAVMARMSRVAERSSIEIWTLSQQSS
ncbi:hypothetical protein [Shimia biformata]|uniref:hypothetical protein n=1 Tax=Shimia biformata TaxID=1294299 RepID=UPI00194E9388|nr:hypothetical protein [Shimia biformata]